MCVFLYKDGSCVSFGLVLPIIMNAEDLLELDCEMFDIEIRSANHTSHHTSIEYHMSMMFNTSVFS